MANDKCRSWRDQRATMSAIMQKQTLAKCMAQDCVQSLQGEGNNPVQNHNCRFMDKLGLCLAYEVGQIFCAQNLNDPACTNDGGPTWAMPPVGTALTADDTQWVPKRGAVVAGTVPGAGTSYDCVCLKRCGCKDKSSTPSQKNECTCYDDKYQKTWGIGTDLDPGQVVWKQSHTSSNLKINCACSCGGFSSF
mmetsp:Transcript_60004/g.125523  ORF Transcript_60004/g.125523 Transcript_60004/m.125523 type:complete len:192 (-) Transcript_60004:403-978(-)